MRKTCARIQACKIEPSERHKHREQNTDAVRKDLSKNNRQEIAESIAHRLSRIKDIYEATVGQKMQKSAEPILECVLVIDKDTTFDQVKEFGRLCHDRLGLTPFQWFTHMDEGHYDKESGEWIPNYHAHIVFDATERRHRMVERTKKSNGRNLKTADGKPIKIMVDGYGKTIKLDRKDLMIMQDLAAQATGLERGDPSSKSAIDRISLKMEQRDQRVDALQEAIRNQANEIKELREENKKLQEQVGSMHKTSVWNKLFRKN